MKYRSIIISLAFLFTTTALNAQLNVVQFGALDSLQRIHKKPVVVFIHTDWCKYCGAMKNATLKKKDVIQLLNEKFYFVSFNAEQKEDIEFSGKKFIYKPT